MLRPRVKTWLLAASAAVALDSSALVQVHVKGEDSQRQESDGRGTRLELRNYIDLQYYVNFSLGTPPQQITGIIDTGSFELVVFSKDCTGCGLAGAFEGDRSTTHRLGRLVTQLTYGSGDVEGDQVEDAVALGSSRPARQNFWEVHKASMPLLDHAKFQSILGVGPPETPAADAWDFVSKAVQEASASMASGHHKHPSNAAMKNVESTLISAIEISKTKTMLNNFGVRTFSICLGRKPGANGYFIWNDTAVLDRPELFSTLPVVGKHSWTLKMTDVRLRARGPGYAQADGETYLGCQGGCGAIIDSGTSLLVIPDSAISLLTETLQTDGLDCDSLHELPSLILTINGREFSLSPDAFVSRKRHSEPCKLELSVLQSTSTSEVGPVWILGMPFLRQYYTTFDVGENLPSRALHVAPASGNCTPGGAGLELAEDRARPYLRSVDRESMYLPPLVKRVTSQAFLRI
mmetsp:Transcript_102549/g.299153  ORF Transcript_102549/g.299153 Transcript_102549/m.299153 type:complete len:463 (-) Transcript_102549:76-1464(-)